MLKTASLRLPSMIELQTLVEIARRGYTTAAAESLNLSQSAVSKQLISIENLAGHPLFERTRHGMIPTQAGLIYIEKARIAIKAMEDAALQVARLNPQKKTLRVQVLPILGDRWLLPRFATFTDQHPEIDVQFTNFADVSQSETPDAVFTFGSEPPAIDSSIYLFGKEALLVASPSYWQRTGSPKCFNDLAHCTFLEHPNTPFLWEPFARSQGHANARPERVIRFGYYTMVIRAALSGQGMALIPKGLIEEELQLGKLVSHPQIRYAGHAAYWYTPRVADEKRSELAPVLEAFTTWVRASVPQSADLHMAND